MGNQSINSLALISARYTITAAEVLAHLAAAHLVALCQALDLRALHSQFVASLEPIFKKLTRSYLYQCEIQGPMTLSHDDIANNIWDKFSQVIDQTTHMDSEIRFRNAVSVFLDPILEHVSSSQASLDSARAWQKECVSESYRTYNEVRARYLKEPDAKPILGMAARRLYSYIRDSLEVPFFGEEYTRKAEWAQETETSQDVNTTARYQSVGAMILAVFDAIRNVSLHLVVLECLQEASKRKEST